MNRKLKLAAAASAVALTIGVSSPAFAEGTTAGTDITNQVTVNFEVGGVAQTAVDNSDTFVVDRKINLTVAASDSVTTSVSPNQQDQVTTFVVTNTSNDVLDFELGVTNQAGGAAPNGGTDNFDATGLQIFVDSNGNGVYDAGTDTETFIDELAEDASITVFVLGDIPVSQVTDDVAAVTLTATGREGAGAGSLGAVLTEDTGADGANTVETVFADAAGDTDANRDAAFSATDDYTVLAADITVAKTSQVLWDPINGTTNPKAIPGAIVEYCIAVSNAAGGADAAAVSISDDLNNTGNVTFYTTAPTPPANGTTDTPPAPNGVISATACDGTGTNGDASALGEAGGVVSGNLGNVAAGDTETLIFRVTVD
ncbi:hypothetical protein [Alterisphingorhabdus coralli]|uniref:DUF11 domain-containing protein n=1 Tax=Alterisphingorhabdus coralli TaxID=3071408 RepID=A0AA97F414_9SPHN|nr:hypothetical protein [Parasphingorhabdus sp. SCSIO 66989]WOE73899.1 hypothetical protein RB602_08465 [Parasphingorhabdus sp. SCSIO 66989]